MSRMHYIIDPAEDSPAPDEFVHQDNHNVIPRGMPTDDPWWGKSREDKYPSKHHGSRWWRFANRWLW